MPLAATCAAQTLGPWLVLSLSADRGRVEVALGAPDTNGFAPAWWVARDGAAGFAFANALARGLDAPPPPSDATPTAGRLALGAARVSGDTDGGFAKLCFTATAELYLSWRGDRAELREKDDEACGDVIAAVFAAVGVRPPARPAPAPAPPPDWQVDPVPLVGRLIPVPEDASALRAAWVDAEDDSPWAGGFLVATEHRTVRVGTDGACTDIGPAPSETTQVAWSGGRAWFAYRGRDGRYAVASLAPGEAHLRGVALGGHDALQHPLERTDAGLVLLVHAPPSSRARDEGSRVRARAVDPATLRTRALRGRRPPPLARTEDGETVELSGRAYTIPGARTVRVQRVAGGHVLRGGAGYAWMVDDAGRGHVLSPRWLDPRAATCISDDGAWVLYSTPRGDAFVGRVSDRWRTGDAPDTDADAVDRALIRDWTAGLAVLGGRLLPVARRRIAAATGLAVEAVDDRLDAAVAAQVERDAAASTAAIDRWAAGDADAAHTLAALPAVGVARVLQHRGPDGRLDEAAATALRADVAAAAREEIRARLDLAGIRRLLVPRTRVAPEVVAGWRELLDRAEAEGPAADGVRRRLSEPDGVELSAATLARVEERLTRLARLVELRAPAILAEACVDDVHTALAADA